MGEDIVAIFDLRVALKATLERCRVAKGFAVVKLRVSPAAGRSVFAGVLDHELDAVLGAPGDERLFLAKGLVVFLRRVVTPGDAGDDRAVRKRRLGFPRFPVGLDRYIVAQDGPYVVQGAFFAGHGDQPPIAVAHREFAFGDGSRGVIGASRYAGYRGDNADRYNCTHQESESFH